MSVTVSDITTEWPAATSSASSTQLARWLRMALVQVPDLGDVDVTDEAIMAYVAHRAEVRKLAATGSSGAPKQVVSAASFEGRSVSYAATASTPAATSNLESDYQSTAPGRVYLALTEQNTPQRWYQ